MNKLDEILSELVKANKMHTQNIKQLALNDDRIIALQEKQAVILGKLVNMATKKK